MQNYLRDFLLLVLQLQAICFTSASIIPFFNPSSLSVLCYKSVVNQNTILQPENGIVVPCPTPVPKLRAGRHEVAVVGEYYTEPPEWINVTLATIGQNFLKKNIVGYLYSVAMGTLLVGTSHDLRRVILSAGNILTIEKAAVRYLGTVLHTLYWANGDIGTSKRNSNKNVHRANQTDMFETLNLIRSVHGEVVHQASAYSDKYKKPILLKPILQLQTNDPLWKALYKDLVASPLADFKNRSIFPPTDGGTQHYFNQFGIMLQYWANIFLPIMKPEVSMFITKPTDEELLGYLHFWGFLAHVMGLRPEYNVCLQPDIPTARKYFQDVLEEYFLPGLFELNYETKVVLEVATKGLAKTFPFLDEGLLIKLLLEDVLGVEANNVQKAMSRQSKIYASIMKRFRYLTDSPGTNSAVRFIMKGLIQVSTIEKFGFNILLVDNFTDGIIGYDESVLRNVNLWKQFKNISVDKHIYV